MLMDLVGWLVREAHDRRERGLPIMPLPPPRAPHHQQQQQPHPDSDSDPEALTSCMFIFWYLVFTSSLYFVTDVQTYLIYVIFKFVFSYLLT
ncbi:hypothetical protein Hanom_Chr16g01437821 [Helianthus anomalus]